MSAEIQLPSPEWNSELHKVILELEALRQKHLHSEVPPYIFLQLKDIFQILENLGSARIEGNNTTLAEYVERIIEQDAKVDEKQQELSNIERATAFIENNTRTDTPINRAYLSELHKIVTKNLTPPPRGEGSNYPGELRPVNLEIQKSNHTPPDKAVLVEYFEKFTAFINYPHSAQNQLLMVALAHHRFMYIHPFDNGNGRMGRLLNYALLIKMGFNVAAGGRILNPSSIFYTDREQYYDKLGRADSLSPSDLLGWCEYFLSGLRNQVEKINHLMNRQYTRDEILLPALKYALERKQITPQENEILTYLVKKNDMAMKATELGKFGVNGSQQKSYVMGRLRDKNMVKPTTGLNGRTYTIRFANNYLLRSVIKTLEEHGFIAEFLNQNQSAT